MKNFRNLDVWQKAHQLAVTVYATTVSFPRDEVYGLTSQMRRACVSVPANIAEGCGKQGDADFGRFLQIAMGSASELEYYILLARELGFLTETECVSLGNYVCEVKRMLAVLIQRLKADNRKPSNESRVPKADS